METVRASTFAGGTGTASDPYHISNVYELQNMSTDLYAHYILVNDINAGVTSSWNSGEGFVPIGNSLNIFRGSLDGQGYSISNLYISRPTTDYVGLFGFISDEASISNVSLVNNDITGQSYLGAFVGYNNGGTIINCSSTGVVNGTVTSGGPVGGFVGLNSGIIDKCYAKEIVIGGFIYYYQARIGGFVGTNYRTVMNSYATGEVSGYWFVGGFAGENSNSIQNCYATGDVSGKADLGTTSGFIGRSSGTGDVPTVNYCYATGNVSGYSSVGGLVGYTDLKGYFNNSFATSDVNGNGSSVGGLVGSASEVSLNNCYATGKVNGPSRIGGLVGFASEVSLNNCYAIGDVSGEVSDLGGLVGRASYSSVNECYAIGNVNGSTDSTGLGGLVGSATLSSLNTCYAVGNVDGDWSVSGLVGSAYQCSLYDCYATGDVKGNGSIGGLVGYAYYYSSLNNCYATGNVSGEDNSYSVAGLVGATNRVTLNNCYATGNVSADVSSEDSYDTGGLIGWAHYSSLSECFATGDIRGYGYIGGLVGYVSSESVISNSYARGDVNGSICVGGLIGQFSGDTVMNCYSTGSVDSGLTSNFLGGLIGYKLSSSSITNSFWDNETSGQSTSDGGTGKYTADMKDVATYTDTSTTGLSYPWDFNGNPYEDTAYEDIWDIESEINDGYPFLTWSVENLTDKTPPIADAGEDRIGYVGELVTFNGEGSWDKIGIVNYTWTIQTMEYYGEVVTYTFYGTGAFTVELNVTDGAGNWDTDTVEITVYQNTGPTADAGGNRTVNEDTVVTFNGSGSYDNVGIFNYTWMIEGMFYYGEEVTYTFYEPGIYLVELNVTDERYNWDTDTVEITVLDVTVPIADAGEDQTVDEGTEVTLNGSGSTDNVGIVNYTWMIEGMEYYGEVVNYTFEIPGNYTIELNVSDEAGNWDKDTVNIIVRPSIREFGLYADQDILIGKIIVWTDGDYLYVNYTITVENWYLKEIHLDVGNDLSDIPQNKKGNPITGGFTYSWVSTTPETTWHLMTINISEEELGGDIIIAAYADVENSNNHPIVDEGAWAATAPGENRFVEKGSWATYVVYEM